jgi:hypothetical protein
MNLSALCKSLTSRLTEAIEDGDGTLSALRIIIVLWFGTVLGVWVYLSLRTHLLQPVDSSITHLLEVLAGSKVIQKFAEKRSD